MSTLTNRTIRSTYDQLIHLEELQFQDGFGTSSLSGSYDLVGDQKISGSLFMSGNFHLNGTASIDYLVASYESSSIIFSSGSTKFGDTLDDTHEFTGSITSTGSFYGMAVSGNFTGSGEGLYDIPSASHAETASYASASVSATSASAAGFASNLSLNTEESSGAGHYILFGPNTSGETAIKTDGNFSYVPLTETLTVTKVIGNLEGTATNAETASLLLGSVENAIFAQTASLAISTSVVTETSTSYAESGDGPFTGSFSSSLYSFLSGSFTGSSLGTFTGSLLGNVTGNVEGDLTGTASIADLATTASHTAGTASIADLATTASQADDATTSSFSSTGDGIFSGSFSGSFTGDGTLLTGSYTVANPGNNRILTSVDAVNGNAEANLSFDGSTLTVVGNINTGQGVTEIYLMNQNVRTSDNVSFLSITETSAERYKENIQTLESNPILNLRPVTFDWKETGASDIGLIAEEVNVHLPELVKKNEEGEVEGIKYSKLTSLLIDIVQKQQSQIESLQGEIKWIKNRL
jgi:hypothetical protein